MSASRSEVAVVGGGPAGALAGALLAQAGRAVTVFDERLAWEKPCGGGVTAKTLARYPFLNHNPHPKREVRRLDLGIHNGPQIRFHLREPLTIYSRLTLNGLLLERARNAGCQLAQDRITAVEPAPEGGWRLQGSLGPHAAEFIVLAAGARAALAGLPGAETLPSSRRDAGMALGYFLPGEQEHAEIEFQPGFEGYLWIFPRIDHLCAGICGPLLRESSARMRARLEDYLQRRKLRCAEGRFYSHRLPWLTVDAWRSHHPGGLGWAAVGDAAGLVDSITGEGLYYALRSAELFADGYLAGDVASYPARLREDFGRDLETSARLSPRFYHDTFLAAPVTTRMVQFSARSATYRAVMEDLFSGAQSYLGLKRRLVHDLPRTLWEVGTSWA
jgi:flavin-dependent dehydrogenase